MSRKIFSIALTLLVFVSAHLAEAQQPAKVIRIGILSGANPRSTPFFDDFWRELRKLAYVEGQNLAIEFRNAEGKRERLSELAAELVQLKVDVIMTAGAAATQAAKQATTTIPIIQGSGGDLVEAGLVASLARPGGNITGLSIPNTLGGGKRLQLLKEAVPQASRMAVLWNVTVPTKVLEWQDTQDAARALRVQLQSVEVRGPNDFASAFSAITKARPEALITFAESLTIRHRKQIADFATENRLPMIAELREFAEAGGLMSYGPSVSDLWRRAAYYVDRILKGAKPADLPVEQPMKFELIINLKTAKQIGLTIPPNVLARADKVIR